MNLSAIQVYTRAHTQTRECTLTNTQVPTPCFLQLLNRVDLESYHQGTELKTQVVVRLFIVKHMGKIIIFLTGLVQGLLLPPLLMT